MRQLLLRRIAQDAPFKEPEIETIVGGIANFFLMNPLELASWELLLHSTSRAERSLPAPLLYIYTAYLAKVSLNESTELFSRELARLVPDFLYSYQNWLLMTNCPLAIDVVELNERLKKMLSSHHKFTDYDTMIESLMAYPRRKDSLCSEVSTLSDVNLVAADFFDYMGADKLSPLVIE